MPKTAGLPPGTLILLILRVVRPGPLHGYAIAQRIRHLSSDQLSVEEGSLYPALQKALANGWLKADWTTSDTGRQVRSYRITAKGLKQLETEQDDYQRMADAITAILESHEAAEGAEGADMSNWFRRVWHLLNRSRHERELVREMTRASRIHGGSARGSAIRIACSNSPAMRGDGTGWTMPLQDLRLGIRGLMRAPTFAITAALMLTFGIGLNLTLYQMANVGLLRPPDITSPETLARFKRRSPGTGISGVSYPLAQLVASENTVLSAVLLENNAAVAWGKELWSVTASFVSPNWFSQLGGTPAQGRLFAEGVDTQSSAPVAVITNQFWRIRLGSDPNIVGSTVEVNRLPVTVIGITAHEFVGTDNDQPSVYLVLDQREAVFPDSAFLRSWETETTCLYGRLKDGVSPEAARESLRGLMAALREQQPDHIVKDEWLDPAMGSANFMDQGERVGIVGALSLLGLLTTLVLVVAATNVGNLVLSRATGRSRELGVRVALGAKRSRIVRQLVIETLPLAMLGAAGGITLASWAAATIAAAGGMPDNISFAPDWRTIGCQPHAERRSHCS